MLNPTRQEDEPTLFNIKRLITAAKRYRTFQDIEHFILRPIRMVRRFFAFLGAVFQDSPPYFRQFCWL
jgi:hypothetical protein